MNGTQLPLGIRLPRDPGLEDFIAGPNAAALAAVRDCAAGVGQPYVYLWGQRGSGKTHLLLGACRAVEASGGSSQYLDLHRCVQWNPDLVEGLEGLALVGLDRIQAVAGNRAWETALFDLYNRLRETGTRLLVAGDAAAAALPMALADLRSRLAWGPGFRLKALDDEMRIELLQRSAAKRGMRLDAKAARYILHHGRRDLHSLESLLDRLDVATLAEQRHPTIPLIRDLLQLRDG
jgi:DnaA family protein